MIASGLRLKEPHRVIVPLSDDEVAKFWQSFRTFRDLALVALMLLNGLRSQEMLDDTCFRSARQERAWRRFRGSTTGSAPRATSQREPASTVRQSTASKEASDSRNQLEKKLAEAELTLARAGDELRNWHA